LTSQRLTTKFETDAECLRQISFFKTRLSTFPEITTSVTNQRTNNQRTKQPTNSWACARGTPAVDMTAMTSSIHVTSSATSPTDSARPLSYRLPIVTNPLFSVVSEIFGVKNGRRHARRVHVRIKRHTGTHHSRRLGNSRERDRCKCCDGVLQVNITTLGWDYTQRVDSSEWELVRTKTERNSVVYECCPNAYVDVQFKLTLKRRPTFASHVFIAPSVILCLITPSIFLMPPASFEKLTLGQFLIRSVMSAVK